MTLALCTGAKPYQKSLYQLYEQCAVMKDEFSRISSSKSSSSLNSNEYPYTVPEHMETVLANVLQHLSSAQEIILHTQKSMKEDSPTYEPIADHSPSPEQSTTQDTGDESASENIDVTLQTESTDRLVLPSSEECLRILKVILTYGWRAKMLKTFRESGKARLARSDFAESKLMVSTRYNRHRKKSGGQKPLDILEERWLTCNSECRNQGCKLTKYPHFICSDTGGGRKTAALMLHPNIKRIVDSCPQQALMDFLKSR